MKLNMTHWAAAAAAALAAAAPGYAATVSIAAGSNFTVFDPAGSGRAADLIFNGGSGALEFSNGTGVAGGTPVGSVGGLVGALNIGQVLLKPLDNAVITETPVDIDGDIFRGQVSIGATVSSLSVDNVTGQILSASSVGGAEQVAARLSGVLNGGDVKVSNLRFDLANKQVIADMEGTPLVLTDGAWIPGTTTAKKDLVLWDISTITGPTALRPEALLAAGNGDFSKMQFDGYTLLKIDPTSDPRFPLYAAGAVDVFGGLKVTQAGFDFFTASLGIKSTSTAYATLKGVNDQADGWGTISSTLIFSVQELGPNPTVLPEPSSYILMGLGLVGVSLVARRRQAA